MATFPASLPRPQPSGYSLKPVDQTVRTDMEVGLARQRRRTQDRNDNVEVTWWFSDSEMNTFRTWFDGDAEGGAAWFDGVELALGNEVVSSTARFIGTWSATLIAGTLEWAVKATLEVA